MYINQNFSLSSECQARDSARRRAKADRIGPIFKAANKLYNLPKHTRQFHPGLPKKELGDKNQSVKDLMASASTKKCPLEDELSELASKRVKYTDPAVLEKLDLIINEMAKLKPLSEKSQTQESKLSSEIS